MIVLFWFVFFFPLPLLAGSDVGWQRRGELGEGLVVLSCMAAKDFGLRSGCLQRGLLE